MKKRSYIMQINREEMKEYSEYFRNMRQAINYTQVEMAKVLGVHFVTYSRWERGERIPHQDVDSIVECMRELVKKRRLVSV